MAVHIRNAQRYLGRNPDELSLAERSDLAGTWVALELYHPANLALRRIAALGQSPEACQAVLREQGKDSGEFQFILMRGAA
ncbi:MAG: hypothetical protein IT170_05935 [Bryobacterales bacterium]|nr:hypothetical protein [Bryobacterales bacterium]